MAIAGTDFIVNVVVDAVVEGFDGVLCANVDYVREAGNTAIYVIKDNLRATPAIEGFEAIEELVII
jgi:hypothetical protein